MSEVPESHTRRRANVRRTALVAVSVSVLMLGFGYALVPLYELFCEVTGFGGRVGQAAEVEVSADAQIVPARDIALRLDATVGSPGRFDFFPQSGKLSIPTGEEVNLHYTVVNRLDTGVVGQAIPSVVPAEAAAYVKKMECFCFTQQVLGPHQAMELPVRLLIDSRLPDDVAEITLSYTYYDSSEQHPELLTDHSLH